MNSPSTGLADRATDVLSWSVPRSHRTSRRPQAHFNASQKGGGRRFRNQAFRRRQAVRLLHPARRLGGREPAHADRGCRGQHLGGRQHQLRAIFPVSPTPFSRSSAAASKRAFGGAHPDGSKLLYATYLGGSGDEMIRSMVFGTKGEVYLAGTPDRPISDHARCIAGETRWRPRCVHRQNSAFDDKISIAIQRVSISQQIRKDASSTPRWDTPPSQTTHRGVRLERGCEWRDERRTHGGHRR